MGQEYVAIDDFQGAIDCTKMNAQAHGLGTKLKTLHSDITKVYYDGKLFSDSEHTVLDKPVLTTDSFIKEQAKYKSILLNLNLPQEYDLIICNPPWIPASKVKAVNPLDNGVYDPDEKFLKSALNFARLHLTPNRKGRMLLVYSDLAQILGLQQIERVEEL